MEAQFLGLKDGKINLHKMNGVKIAVPVSKMSVADLEYVERMTGISLDEDKPLSELKKSRAPKEHAGGSSSTSRVGASVEQPKKPEYDWFQFFLSCDVGVGLCERYAQAFARDSMDESVLPDVDAGILRNLGLREGDIIKVMRYLDNKYNRTKKKGEEDGEAAGGLFSGPGGTLRNNTRRGRPEPTRQASDVVDPKALLQKELAEASAASSPAPLTPATTTTSLSTGKPSGFDDDAWDVKPSKQQPTAQTPPSAPRPTETSTASPPAPAAPPKPAAPALTPGMQELSLLSQPLQPTKVASPPPQAAPVLMQLPAQVQPPAQVPQQTGATPGFFTALAQQQTGLPNGQLQLNTGLAQQQTGYARQRPLPPQATQAQGGLMPPPPPSRPFSAPQSAQPSAFGLPPLQPQMTGQVAPPGQSLNDINQARLQQQYAQQMQQMQQMQQIQSPPPMSGFPQPTGPGMYPMQTGMQSMQPQPTGFGPNQFMQPMMNGPQQIQSPFADPSRQAQFSPVQAQPTGYPAPFNPGQFGGAQPGGINSYLPPAMEPQRTGMPAMQPQPTGMGFTQGFGNAGIPAQQQQQQQPPPMAPLQPQKTGPAPPVRFGVQPEANKLVPQATGRRANLSHASKLQLDILKQITISVANPLNSAAKSLRILKASAAGYYFAS